MRAAVFGRVALLTLAASSHSAAGGLDVDQPSPRSIGRAGAVFVSDDGVGALALSPAALARRTDTRFRLGLTFHDRDSEYRPDSEAVAVEDRSQPVGSPAAAAIASWRGIVFGIAYREPQQAQVRLPAPAFGQPADDVIRFFPYRYAGYDFQIATRELRVGAAVRLSEAVALGAALGARHTRLEERRFAWPGFSGRDGLLNPSVDVDLETTGSDWFAPSASLGVLLAPASVPIEISMAVTGSQGANIEGDVRATGVQPASPAIVGGTGAASTQLADQLVFTSGARVSVGRLAAELGALARLYRGGSPWTTSAVTLADRSGLTAEISSVPGQAKTRNHAAFGAALEAELLPELLWSTFGYQYTVAPTSTANYAPTTAELGGHTAAVGIEFYVSGITATVGYSRTLSRRQSRSLAAESVINPFAGGSAPTGNGSYRRADDRIGFAIEIAYDSILADDELLGATESSTSTNAP